MTQAFAVRREPGSRIPKQGKDHGNEERPPNQANIQRTEAPPATAGGSDALVETQMAIAIAKNAVVIRPA